MFFHVSIWVKRRVFPLPIHWQLPIIFELNKQIFIIEINIVSVIGDFSICLLFNISLICRKCSLGESLYRFIYNYTGERVSLEI